MEHPDVFKGASTSAVPAQDGETFRNVFDHAAIGMAMLTFDGHWFRINPALRDLLGYSTSEIQSLTVSQVTHPDDIESTVERFRQLSAEEVISSTAEKRYIRKNGTVVWAQVNLSVGMDSEDHPAFIIAQVQDITGRKAAEAELVWKTAFLEAQVQSSQDGIVVLNSEGRVLLHNRKMDQLWRFPENIPFGDRTTWIAQQTINPAAFASRTKELLANPDQMIEEEVELKDGRTIQEYSSPVRGKDGRFFGRIFTCRDITARKAFERELEQVRQEHEAVLAGVGDGVHWLGKDGRIKFENPAAAAMLGHEVAELLGQPAHATMHHTKPDGSPFPIEECPIYSTLRDGQARHVTGEVFWRKDGSSFSVEYSVVPTRDMQGQFNGAVVTFVDITERLRLEAQMHQARIAAETANEAKTQFLANMSHEIRTPLNGIIGMTDLMAGTQLNTEQKDFLDTIHASSENLLTIVNDVLDFSKIEFGKLELDYHAFSLLDLIDDVIGILSFRIVKKNLEFVTNIQKDLPVDYLGDATRIRQVLVNLVSNAVKFTERGEIHLEVLAAEPQEGDTDQTQRLLFRVRDTGVGIPADRLNRLFKIFSQVDASTTRRYGGSGLGLAICRKLVEIMGGGIGVESQTDVGSIFSFDIPLRLGHPERAPGEGSDLEGHRVLIVDDLETNRRMLSLQLARWGLDWVDVSTGQDALKLLGRGERFDVALIDFQMPNTDGIMLAREITRLLPDKPVPLVLISSQTGDISIEECTRAGFSAVLAKPLRQNLLRSTLQQVFRSANAPVVQPVVPLLAEKLPLKILTVEDNATNRKVAKQILKRLGYETDLVNNGSEAVVALEQQPYDLIFMDIHMPEMDGIEATREIRRKIYPHGQPLIVALTADVLPGEREKCLECGMDEYLAKPIKIDSLKQVIERIRITRSQEPPPA